MNRVQLCGIFPWGLSCIFSQLVAGAELEWLEEQRAYLSKGLLYLIVSLDCLFTWGLQAVGRAEVFLQSKSFRRDRQKLPVFMKTRPQNATVSLLMYPLSQQSQIRSDSKGWKNKKPIFWWGNACEERREGINDDCIGDKPPLLYRLRGLKLRKKAAKITKPAASRRSRMQTQVWYYPKTSCILSPETFL